MAPYEVATYHILEGKRMSKGIKDQEKWDEYVKYCSQEDEYGKVCVDIAGKVMDKLDEDPTPVSNTIEAKDADERTPVRLVKAAAKELGHTNLSDFRFSMVAQMVDNHHERGNELNILYKPGK